MSNTQIITAAIELLQSGDDEGCDGLVVVTAQAYRQLQVAVEAATGQSHGIDVSSHTEETP